MTEKAEVGEWVQIERTVLPAGKRAPQVPDDTQEQPLVMRVKGFAQHQAQIGDEVTVETVIGRKETGRLVNILPVYDHDFGRPVPELLTVGEEVRRLLREEEATEGSESK